MTASLLPAWPSLLPSTEVGSIRALLAELAQAQWRERDRSQGGLSSGPAGVALFLGHLSRVEGFERWREPARELLEAAVAGLGNLGTTDLYAGFTGVAWAMEHLQAEGLVDLGGDPNQEVDEVLLEHLAGARWDRAYDLVSGLVGYGVYGLARAHRPSGRALLGRVLDHLEESAVRTGEGLAWPSEEREWSGGSEASAMVARWNLGVAHGQPGVLGLLAAMAELGIGGGRTLALYDSGRAWLQARVQPRPWSGLPAWLPRGEQSGAPRNTRVAWCYGDLGAAVVLLGAARRLRRPEEEVLALDLADRAARRPLEEAGLRDACLCHGSLGNAHLFHRLAEMTGSPQFRTAAQAYLREGLSRRRDGEGFCGFLHELPPVVGLRETTIQDSAAGLLEGAAGIGLALISSLGGARPTWDRFLLPA